ncbi:MAG: NusA-like transcription termination signal-binding factor [Asgard group archaeon]|nr:NusA-like transcription termination signal-binding factor [Asgard group archaeon]
MSSNIKINIEEMKAMNIFSNVTKMSPKDCIIDKKLDRIIYVVRRGTVGTCIGRNGLNVKRLKTLLAKDIEIVEDDEKPEQFIKNALVPASVEKVAVVRRKNKPDLAFVTIKRGQRGLAIGKDGRNIERARILAKRHFDIENVIISNQ